MNFKYTCNIRKLLYDKFYTNQNIMSYILQSIMENFDLFSINYIPDNNSIQLKIKKTNIRKNNSFSHTSTYYYNVFTPIFCNIFSNNIQYLSKIIKDNINTYELLGNELEFISNIDNIGLLFNITTLSDNIIIIYL